MPVGLGFAIAKGMAPIVAVEGLRFFSDGEMDNEMRDCSSPCPACHGRTGI